MVLARAKLLAVIVAMLAVQAAVLADECLCTDTGRTLDTELTGGITSCAGGDCYDGDANHSWACTPTGATSSINCRACCRTKTFIWACGVVNGEMQCQWVGYPETNTDYTESGWPASCSVTTNNHYHVHFPARGALISGESYRIEMREVCDTTYGLCSSASYVVSTALLCITEFVDP